MRRNNQPINSSNTIDLLNESNASPVKTGRERRSISHKIKDISYDNKLFDNVDSRIKQYLDKHQVNYEKTLVKMYKLDNLKSEKAKRLLNEMNQSKRKQFSAVRQNKSILRERNNSLPSSKQMQIDLNQIQQELRRINPEIENDSTMNQSKFKFNQSNCARREDAEWERVALYYPQKKLRPKLTNFQEELDRLNQYYSRNENSLNQLMLIQKDLLHYQLLQK